MGEVAPFDSIECEDSAVRERVAKVRHCVAFGGAQPAFGGAQPNNERWRDTSALPRQVIDRAMRTLKPLQ